VDENLFFVGTDPGLFVCRKCEVLIETLDFLGILFLSALGSEAFLNCKSRGVDNRWSPSQVVSEKGRNPLPIHYLYQCFKGESSQKEIARLAGLIR